MREAAQVLRKRVPLKISWERLRSIAEPHMHVWTFLAAVTLCGLVFGGLVSGQLNTADSTVLHQAVQRLLDAVQQHQLASSGDLWWQRMIGDAQLLALVWLFGVSVIGVPFVVIAIFLRAFSVGFSVGFTVIQFGWNGFLMASIGIFLHQLVSLTLFICAGVFAIRFSVNLLRQAFPLQKMSVEFVKYTGWIVLCGFGLMVGAFIQAYLAPTLLFHVLGSPS